MMVLVFRIAFAEAADVGLILIPFSAKDVTGREWHGAGAVCGMPCTLTVIAYVSLILG